MEPVNQCSPWCGTGCGWAVQTLCKQLLPRVCPMMVDPWVDVRNAACRLMAAMTEHYSVGATLLTTLRSPPRLLIPPSLRVWV